MSFQRTSYRTPYPAGSRNSGRGGPVNRQRKQPSCADLPLLLLRETVVLVLPTGTLSDPPTGLKPLGVRWVAVKFSHGYPARGEVRRA